MAKGQLNNWVSENDQAEDNWSCWPNRFGEEWLEVRFMDSNDGDRSRKDTFRDDFRHNEATANWGYQAFNIAHWLSPSNLWPQGIYMPKWTEDCECLLS